MRTSQIGAVLVILCTPLGVHTQTATTATVAGTIVDRNGARIGGATIKLTDTGTGSDRVTTTDSEGRYQFYAISPGLLKVTANASGFRAKIVTGLQVEVSKVTNVDLVMDVGEITETIETRAGVKVALQDRDASIGVVFDDERLRRLPNLSRSTATLFTLQPAAAPRGQFAGSRSDQSTYVLDGVNVTNSIEGSLSFPVPVESIDEFRGTVVNANASFGSVPGAQLVMVTRRGSNQFHGGAYFYHQNNALAANSWTNNRLGIKRPFLLDNRFGATFGGPVWKDKTFVFAHYESRRNPNSATVTRVVPMDSLRAGTLRFRDASGAVQTIDQAAIRSLDSRHFGPNPKILEYLNLYPRANNFSAGDGLNTAGFTFVAPLMSESNFGLLRIDHKLSEQWMATAKFAADRQIATTAFQVDLEKQAATSGSSSRPRNAVVTVLGAISPNLTSESRFSWLHSRGDFNSAAPTQFVGLNAAINLGAGLLDDIVDVDAQRARRQYGRTNVYQIAEIATWSRGAHNLQFGGNLQYLRSRLFRNDKVLSSLTDPVADVSTAGGYVLIPADERPAFIRPIDVNTYNTLYASLLGMVSQVPVLVTRDGNLKPEPLGTGLVTDSTARVWDFFLTDAWRWRPSLTLTYGLSYGWQTPPVEASGKQNVLTFRDSGQPVIFQDYIDSRRGAAEAGQVFNPDLAFTPLKSAGRKAIFDTNYGNLSPRLAFAWSPSFKNSWLSTIAGDRKTVVRGGYSLLYDRTNAVQSIALPTLGAGFAQTISVIGPRNSGGVPFRVGVDGPIPLPVAPSVAGTSVVPATPFGEILSFSVDPRLRTPKNHVFDFTIQRELPWNLLLEVGYIGRLARNLYVSGNLNSVPLMHRDVRSGQTFAQAFDAVAVALRNKASVSAQPYFENLYGAGTTAAIANSYAGDFIAGNVNTIQQIGLDLAAFQTGRGPVLTNLQVQSLSVRFSGASSSYHALVATLHKRYSKLTFDLNYTLSQFLDQVYLETQNQISEIQSSFDMDIDYGAADADHRHLFNANASYDLPFGKGQRLSFSNPVLNHIIGGWFTAGIFRAQGGTALSVFQSNQAFGGSPFLGVFGSAVPISGMDANESLYSGVTGSNGIGINSDPARRGSGFNLFADPEAVYRNFRPALISQDGRTGRGVLRGLPRWNLDWTLGKQTHITENVKLTLSFDFINPLNHVILSDPPLNLSPTANFGVLSNQANSPRRIQIGARLDF